MKTRTLLCVIVCLSTLFAFAQDDLKLTLLKKSDEPISKSERFYLFKIENISNKNHVIDLVSLNSSCTDIGDVSQTDLIHTFISEDQNNLNKKQTIRSGESIKFYVKFSRPKNITLNSWNCTEVVVKTTTNLRSNSVTIKTLVPDPSDFN